MYMHRIVGLNRSPRFSLSVPEMTLCHTEVLVSKLIDHVAAIPTRIEHTMPPFPVSLLRIQLR
jgi:hypothetical protein